MPAEPLSDRSASDPVWLVRRDGGPLVLSYEDPRQLVADGLAPAWEEATVSGPYVPASERDRLAGEVERLREENRMLTVALRPFADAGRQVDGWLGPNTIDWARASATLAPASGERRDDA